MIITFRESVQLTSLQLYFVIKLLESFKVSRHRFLDYYVKQLKRGGGREKEEKEKRGKGVGSE